MNMKEDHPMHLKAYKYRLYPNKQQEEYLSKVFGCVRFIWNRMLDEKMNATGHIPQVTPAQYKEEYPWLYEVDSLALANTQLHLEKAFRNHFRDPKRFEKPSFKKKRNEQSFTTNHVNGNIKIDFDNSTVKIPKLNIPIKVKFHRKFEGTVKSVTIRKKPSGRYYVSILVEEKIEPLKPVYSACGIDVGIKDFATITQGNGVTKKRIHKPNPEYLEKSKMMLTKLQRQLDKKVHPRRKGDKTKKSKNYIKYAKRVAKLHEHVSNQRLDFLHKLSSTVIHENQVIVVEDLNVEGMLKNRHLAKTISSVSWSTFINMLQYKADWYDREFIKEDRFFASTQKCSKCGYKNPLLKDLSIREWICPVCGTHHDRDENSSDNGYEVALIRLKQLVGQELPEPTPVERDNMDDRMATYLKSEPSLKQEATTSTSGR